MPQETDLPGGTDLPWGTVLVAYFYAKGDRPLNGDVPDKQKAVIINAGTSVNSSYRQ